jgi:hypothetical protein
VFVGRDHLFGIFNKEQSISSAHIHQSPTAYINDPEVQKDHNIGGESGNEEHWVLGAEDGKVITLNPHNNRFSIGNVYDPDNDHPNAMTIRELLRHYPFWEMVDPLAVTNLKGTTTVFRTADEYLNDVVQKKIDDGVWTIEQSTDSKNLETLIKSDEFIKGCSGFIEGTLQQIEHNIDLGTAEQVVFPDYMKRLAMFRRTAPGGINSDIFKTELVLHLLEQKFSDLREVSLRVKGLHIENIIKNLKVYFPNIKIYYFDFSNTKISDFTERNLN